MMNTYQTLSQIEINLDELPPEQKQLFDRVNSYYQTSPSWNEFSNFWMKQIITLTPGVSQAQREKIAKTPLFMICQDMDSRLGIKQGFCRKTDDRLRCALEQIIYLSFGTIADFCRLTGTNERQLRYTLNEDCDLPINKFEEIINKAGFEMIFRKNSRKD